jgi:hypothetical protein
VALIEIVTEDLPGWREGQKLHDGPFLQKNLKSCKAFFRE